MGVLLFKPGTLVTDEVLDSLDRRIAECGFVVLSARSIPPAEVVGAGLMRRHYAAHWKIASAGRLQPQERLRLLDLYDRPAFAERFGVTAPDVPVLPVLEFLHGSGIRPEVVDAWSEESAKARGLSSGALDGPNELGDLTYVNVFEPGGGSSPVFLLNPHLPSVTAWSEQSPDPVVALLLGTATNGALPWGRMRSEFCGGSDPSISPPGSLRRDMWDGLWPLRYRDGLVVGPARNGVHLSNGPVEAVREASIWFGITPEATPMGRTLLAACTGSTPFLECEYLSVGGRNRVLVDVTRNLTAEEAAALLRAGRLWSIDSQADNRATLRRVDVAHVVAQDLARDPAVLAVLIGGSVALNRASSDSDLDLVIVMDGPEGSGTIERRECRGVSVELERLQLNDALDRAGGGDNVPLRALRRSARLGLALPVYDPEGIAARLAARAATAGPDLGDCGEQLMEAYGLLASVAEQPAGLGGSSWPALRGIYDVVAVLLLLTGPFRYQKPKWVVTDLEETGNADVAAALLHAYGVDDDPAAALDTVERCQRVIDQAAAAAGLPSVTTVQGVGLISEHPEYSYLCHCLGDARSLLADGWWAGASYAARFSFRMAAAVPGGSNGTTLVSGLENEGGPIEAAIFGDRARGPVEEADLERVLAHLERCRMALFGPAS